MDVELVEVQESIATVLGEECPSLAVHAFIDGRDALDQRLRTLASELGWLLIALPEAQGGLGLGAAGLAMLHFELGRAVAPGALLGTSIAIEVLAQSASADSAVVQQLLAEVTGGTASIAVPARSAPAGTGAIWLLGEEQAAAAIVPGADDDMVLVDLAGLSPARVAIWDETRSVVTLDPAGAPVLVALPGARPLFECLFALALAADSAGAAKGVLDRTVAYMKEREQFGRLIGSFQALKHRAADHLVNATAAEQLVWQAADQFGADGEGALVWSAMAKANVTEAAARIAGDCVQLHGGVGYTREYDPQLYLKRVRFNEALLAPNAVLRDRAEQAFRAGLSSGREMLEIA
ncbi:MAG TPA: acyl-CoA dehydrogenase [Novosphingobium sp.]